MIYNYCLKNIKNYSTKAKKPFYSIVNILKKSVKSMDVEHERYAHLHTFHFFNLCKLFIKMQ